MIRNFVIAVACAVAAGCGPSRPTLLPIALPDLSHVDPAVQKQARETYARLNQRIADRRTPPSDLATAYGQLGMVLQAAEFPDAAEPCYLNAQSLAPDQLRWPYYLGGLYKTKGQPDKAVDAYTRALALRPDDFPTLIWLGRLYLDQGKPEDAGRLFEKALRLMPQSVAALAGLGRTNLARRNYANAAQELEQALAIDPQAESLHAPLAVAYRGLGELDKAQPHLRQWRNTDILLPDPLQQELDLLLESGLSYELRGVRALEARDWKTAAGFFDHGLGLARADTPLHRSLQHKLGTALYMRGDVDGAMKQFDAVVASAPKDGIDESTAKAHYSIGILMAEKGREDDALAHLQAAIRYQPSYLEAHLGLADALRRRERFDEALHQYDEAIAINPREPAGILGHAIALVALKRSREARDFLAESIEQHPDQPAYAHALARVLVTASDPGVRDLARANTLIEELFRKDRSTSLGETMAMALAAMGDFQQAQNIQRGIIAAAEKAHLDTDVQRMQANLRRYEQHQPCRVAWPNDEPVFLPPPVTQ